MRTVYKYPLKLVETQTIEMPRQCAMLTVQIQAGEICLWAEVVLDGKVEARTIRLVGTGNPMPEGTVYLAYIGTVQMLPYVWHIYEELPEESDEWPDDREEDILDG
jgi:hypothetical protein